MGSYTVHSGTSTSAPLAAAIIALNAEVRGTLEPELMNNLFSSTAKPQPFSDGHKIFSELAPAPQQGGGIVQAYDAAYTASLLSPASLSFNDTDHLATNLNFTITNKGSHAVTYKLGQVPSLTIAVVGVTAKPAAGVINPKRLALWSGYVTINGTNGSALSMPYQGLTGSLRKATVLARHQAWVFHSTDSTDFTRSPDRFTYVVPKADTSEDDDDLPAIGVNLALGSPMLHIDVVPVGNGTETSKSIGEPFGLPSPLNERGWTSFPWDGQLQSGKYAPAGQYRFVVRALRIFGDASKPHDWDVATTQSIILKYKS
ncbi:hypothetical protein E4U56_004015 [Claviceps arundinis]|uniref:Peptidase S8/S53 domain-containing protein n=1 Tax=Claviceps arundinis TaxID=1623583 RepID=A0A9P7MZ48_9HYPO|nr:hypothetical protein E4U56_004015 [Claviceps arundinis]